MSNIFDELDQRLSIVPRWVILRTIQKQSVAEHAFNVERIATAISNEWFHITNVNDLYSISQLALHHDDEEALTGDIPSTAKKENHLDKDRGPWYNVVKLADLMEAFWFLSMEYQMGNQYIHAHLSTTETKLRSFAGRHFGEGVQEHLGKWIEDAYRMESQRYE